MGLLSQPRHDIASDGDDEDHDKRQARATVNLSHRRVRNESR